MTRTHLLRGTLLVAGALVLVGVGSRGSFLHALTARAAPPASAPPPRPSPSARAAPPPAHVAAPPAPPPAAEVASAPPASASSAARADALDGQGRVILNEATEEELVHLPGIGRGRAKAILELRAKLGKFRRLEELLRVKGIGRKRLAKLRDRLVLDRA